MAVAGLQTTTMTSYHLQSNRMVERFPRLLKNSLCIVATKSAWVRVLPWALLGLGNAPKEDTKTSGCATVVFGIPLRVPEMGFPELHTHSMIQTKSCRWP